MDVRGSIVTTTMRLSAASPIAAQNLAEAAANTGNTKVGS
jgi:hypothetical protein